jgi:hypothetical protein
MKEILTHDIVVEKAKSGTKAMLLIVAFLCAILIGVIFTFESIGELVAPCIFIMPIVIILTFSTIGTNKNAKAGNYEIFVDTVVDKRIQIRRKDHKVKKKRKIRFQSLDDGKEFTVDKGVYNALEINDHCYILRVKMGRAYSQFLFPETLYELAPELQTKLTTL